MTRTDLVESGAGWYVLVWSGEAGLDAWVESNADRVGAFADGCYGEIEWLSEEESASVPGVTCTTSPTCMSITASAAPVFGGQPIPVEGPSVPCVGWAVQDGPRHFGGSGGVPK